MFVADPSNKMFLARSITLLRYSSPVIFRASFAFILAAGLTASPAFASRIHRAPTSGHAHKTHRNSPAAKTPHLRGQQAIDTQRVTAIQQALIKQHYLTGEPSSRWDADTQAAMIKFQGDQGWQTKLTPDSRALIKLGLGPDHSGAINASSSANFNTLSVPVSATGPAQGFVAASGISH